jgi:hypothetical protein
MPVRPAGSCVFAEEITYTKLVFVDCSAGRGNGVHRGKVSVLRQVMHRAMKHAFSRYRSALEGGVVVDIRELLITDKCPSCKWRTESACREDHYRKRSVGRNRSL